MNQLTAAEKDRLAKQLAYGAIVGGWFLVGMGIFLGGLMFIVAPLLSDIPLEPEVAGPMSMLALAFIGGGWWMIRRRLHFRRLLDGPLLSGRAEVTAISTPAETENGWGIVLRVITPSGLEAEGGLTSYNTPSWSVGDQIELYFLDDEERFDPPQTKTACYKR